MNLDFYTNVSKYGNYIFVSGYKNGEKYFDKEKFQPTLYTKNASSTQPYRTIFDERLMAIKYDTIQDSFQDVKNTKGTNQELFGNTNYIYQWIAENFPDSIQGIDSNALNICIFDLEMESTLYDYPDETKIKVRKKCKS